MSHSSDEEEAPARTMFTGSYKLKFKLVYSSGEDPEYPATQLLSTNPQNRGWHTPKFGEYPQEVIIQFTNIVRLTQMQFLVHEYKIPTRLILSSYMPDGPDTLVSKIKLTNIRFQTLGVVDFGDNENSDFKARELKSISMSTAALLLKIQVDSCYKNEHNIFNQAGIVAMNCLGEVFALPNVVPTQEHTGGRFEDEMQYDPAIINKLKALYVAKETALKNMEYEEAITIKSAINRMKQYGVMLNILEDKKKKYMLKKKYELAQDAKREIKMLREFIANPNKIFNQESIFKKIDDSVLKNMWGGKAEFYSSMLPETSKQLQGTALSYLNLVPLTSDIIMKNDNDRYKIPKNGEDKIIKDEDELDRLKNMYNNYNDPKPMPGKSQKDIEAMNVPFIMNNQEVDEEIKRFEDQDEPSRYNLDAMDLDAETLALAQPMMKAFGMDIMKKLFSIDWHLREEALRDIEREIKLGSKSALCGDLSTEEVF